MSKLIEMFQQGFMINVLVGTMAVAAICSYLSVFIVLQRAVFVGAALAQVSSFGVALALFTSGIVELYTGTHIHLPPQLVALALTIAAAVLMAIQYKERRLPRETAIGVTYAAAAGLAILLVAVSAHGESEVLNLMFGNVLTIGTGEVIGLVGLALIIGLVHWLYYKEFLFVSFDPDMAMALGLRAQLWNVILFLTIGVTISLATLAAGALVVFNFLVLPAAASLALGKNLRTVFILAILIGVISSFAGITISYVADLPSGPTIVAVSTAMLLLTKIKGYSRTKGQKVP